MAKLSLPKLDREPPKEAAYRIVLQPTVNKQLLQYAEAYKEEFGEEPKPEELIPAMLSRFLDSDSAFRDYVKNKTTPTRRRKAATSTASTATKPPAV